MTTRGEPVLVSGWRCECRRCGHKWLSLCDCILITGDRGRTPLRTHRADCEPPRTCGRCKAAYWWQPAGERPRGFAVRPRRRQTAR